MRITFLASAILALSLSSQAHAATYNDFGSTFKPSAQRVEFNWKNENDNHFGRGNNAVSSPSFVFGHDDRDHDRYVQYFKDICDPKGRSPAQCDPSDPSAVPLPNALPLFAAALMLFGLMGWMKKARQ